MAPLQGDIPMVIVSASLDSPYMLPTILNTPLWGWVCSIKYPCGGVSSILDVLSYRQHSYCLLIAVQPCLLVPVANIWYILALKESVGFYVACVPLYIDHLLTLHQSTALCVTRTCACSLLLGWRQTHT